MLRLRWHWLLLVAIGLATYPQWVLAQPGGDPGQTEIFLPIVANYESPATPQPDAQDEQVYGLLGQLEETINRPYAHYLATPDGGRYGLTGETPEVEEEITALGALRPPVTIKVWGTLLPQATGADAPLIVASAILVSNVGSDTPPVAIVTFDRVNLYAGPGSNYARVGQVTLGDACYVIGRNDVSTWLLLRCEGGLEGWIDARLVQLQGTLDGVEVVNPTAVDPPVTSPTATPVVATPTPTAQGWRTTMYANSQLSGSPAAVADYQNIDFDWGYGGPSAAVPVDNFSMRFERTIDFASGYYRFTAEADDGVRFWLDNQLIMDEWHGTTGQTYVVGRVLSGRHNLRVEYFEASGLARVRFHYEVSTESPVWDAAYYRGTTLSGDPVLLQQEPRSQYPLDMDWGYSSPDPVGLGTDFWSARWTGQFVFEEGTYIFRVLTDDGVRVYLDGLRVIDQWTDGYKEASNRFIGVGVGTHTVTVEFYERTGLALVQLWWYEDANYTGPQ
jgi:uncharacterized protein YraI